MKPRERKPSTSTTSESDEEEKVNVTASANPDEQNASSSNAKIPLDFIQEYLAKKLGFLKVDGESSSDSQVLKTVDFRGIIDHWKENGFKKIVTMVGAGISTCKSLLFHAKIQFNLFFFFTSPAAGIPDFRSPTTGLYNNLQKYNLPHPTAIFELDYFIDNPQPFFMLAKELYPGKFKPTPCHYFIRLLHEKGLLLRHYTQNIDTLERIAGIPGEKLVEAHGTFYTNHCLDCRKEYSMEWVKDEIFADGVPTCTECNGIVKPDIVFFGEDLPMKFYTLPENDFDECDLLIIMGTSLEVQPFASLVSRPSRKCVRLLINRERVGHRAGPSSWFSDCDTLKFNMKNNKRDVAWLGDCDDGILELAKELGFEVSFALLIYKEKTEILHSNFLFNILFRMI